MTFAVNATVDRVGAGHSTSPTACALLREFVRFRVRLQVQIRNLVLAYECGPSLEIWLAIVALDRPAEQLMASLANLRACLPLHDWRTRAALYETAVLRDWIAVLFARFRAGHALESGHCRLCDFMEQQSESIGALMSPHEASHDQRREQVM